MKRLLITLPIAAILTYSFMASSHVDSQHTLSLTASPEANYQNYCAGCHGEEMNAFVDRRWKHGNTQTDLVKAIKYGYDDEGMPAFDTTFTDQEVRELADYILTGIENVDRYKFTNELKTDTFLVSGKTLELDTIASGLDVPWGMEFLPNGDMLITERKGDLLLRDTNGKISKIKGGPDVLAQGQGGLLDVKLHPNFSENSYIYLSYSAHKSGDGKKLSTTAIMRAQLKGNKLSNQEIIFEALPYSTTRHHYGSRLEFDEDGYLFFSVGDRGNRNVNPQNLDNHCGKIHRIKDDGSIPEDNPFVNTPGAMASIYSFGHRNPQGVSIQPATGAIWSHEHGPRGGDEINISQPGLNYGWPVISYGINYNGTIFTEITEKEDMQQPLLYWLPSIAPCGMDFIDSDKYGDWKGHLLVGSLRFKYVNLCHIEDNKVVKEEMLFKNIGRVRDVRMGPDGYMYVAVEKPGAVYRVMPVSM